MRYKRLACEQRRRCIEKRKKLREIELALGGELAIKDVKLFTPRKINKLLSSSYK